MFAEPWQQLTWPSSHAISCLLLCGAPTSFGIVRRAQAAWWVVWHAGSLSTCADVVLDVSCQWTHLTLVVACSTDSTDGMLPDSQGTSTGSGQRANSQLAEGPAAPGAADTQPLNQVHGVTCRAAQRTQATDAHTSCSPMHLIHAVAVLDSLQLWLDGHVR
jgi:hypothetical protein